MKTKKWLKICSGLAVILFAVGLSACTACTACEGEESESSSVSSSSPIQSEEEKKEFNLQFSDISVDVTQAPEALYVDDFTLEKVTVGGTALPTTDYVVRNGYFLFGAGQYGAFGLGEKEVQLQFKEGAVEFTLTIVDNKAPIYELPIGKVFLLPTQSAVIPNLMRMEEYQVYDVAYTVKDENNSVVFEKRNPTNGELTLTLENGFYEQQIVVTKGNETLETWQGKLVVADEENIEFVLPEKQLLLSGEQAVMPISLKFSGETFEEEGAIVYESMDEQVITVDTQGKITAVTNGITQVNVTVLGAITKTVNVAVCNADVFSADMAKFWQITTRLDAEGKQVQGSYGNTVWNAEENALVIEKATNGRDNSVGSMRIPVSAIEPMLALGAEYCTFEMKVNDAYIDTVLADTHNGSTGSQMETQLTATLGTKYVAGAGAKSITQSTLKSGKYVTIVLNIKGLVEKYQAGEIDTVRIYLGGKKNSVISLRNFLPIVSSKAGVEISAGESVTLLVGERANVTPTLTVNGELNTTAKLSYKSMDETVVSVSESGTLTPVANGNTQILLTATGYGVSAMVDVSVTDGNVFSYTQNGSGWVGTMRNSKEVKRNDYGYMNQKGYWNETEQAYVLYKYSAARDFSNGCVRFGIADTPALKALLDRNVVYVKFDIKVDETYMASAVGNGVSAESQTKLQMAWRNAEQTVNGYSSSIEKGKLKAGEYVTVYFDLTTCVNAYKDGNVAYLYLFLGGQELSEICLKNFGVATETEYNAWLTK